MKFEGDSQRIGTIIDGFTDLWWFGEAEKGVRVANRTTMIVYSLLGRSHLPRWKNWVKLGGVEQKQSAGLGG